MRQVLVANNFGWLTDMLTLIVQSAREQARSVLVSRFPCVVGRAPEADLQLSGWRVSRVHAHIDRVEQGYRISDSGSLAGVWVNGERISEFGPLRGSDEISIAGYSIRIVEDLERAPVKVGSTPQDFSDESVHVTRSAEPSRVGEDEAFIWRRRLHHRLISEIERRRRDIRQLTDHQLRNESRELLEQILEAEPDISQSVDRSALVQDVIDEAIGLGPLQALMSDEAVSEIMVNGTRAIQVEKSGRLFETNLRFSSDAAIRAVIDRIVTPAGRHIDESSPMVDARLEDGSRVNAVIPPVAIQGPSITIRRFNRRLLSPDELIAYGSVSSDMLSFLKICVEERFNVLISGGTGSGKTTLLNLLAGFIPAQERVITIEDAAELRLLQRNHVALEARPCNLEGKGRISIRDLVRNALRMRPDRIVIGECRGGEALDMLQAMNTGHEGSLTTIHANGARDAVSRLEVMAMMAGVELPIIAIREQIASAIQIVVHQARCSDGTRRVLEISEITGLEGGRILMQPIFQLKRDQSSSDRSATSFVCSGNIPHFFEKLRERGASVDLGLFERTSV
jgi:pilus assembly protein CpaF